MNKQMKVLYAICILITISTAISVIVGICYKDCELIRNAALSGSLLLSGVMPVIAAVQSNN